MHTNTQPATSVRQLLNATAPRSGATPRPVRSAPVVMVLGGHAGSGASTTALALGDVAAARMEGAEDNGVVQLVDAAAPQWSGLAEAPEQELEVVNGWRRGRRGTRVVVDRVESLPIRIGDVPPPTDLPGLAAADIMVVDAGWHARELIAKSDGWLHPDYADVTVVVSRSAPAQLAQTEWVLRELVAGPTVAVVVGAGRKVRDAMTAAGPRLRRLDGHGLLVTAPLLSPRSKRALDTGRMSAPLEASARELETCVRALAQSSNCAEKGA